MTLHTMHFTGIGRSHDEALRMAEAIANHTFPAISLLSGQRVSLMSPLLLPDLVPSIRQACLVYVLDVPAGGGEVLDARRTEIEQEVRAASPPPTIEQVYVPFRAAISLSPARRATHQLGPYSITVEQEKTTMYRVKMRLGEANPHLSELTGKLDTCEAFLCEKGIPLDGWVPEES